MRESGDDLVLIFDRMAAHGVIDHDPWAAFNVVTTSNAQAQAKARQRSKAKSEYANKVKQAKAKKNLGGNHSVEP